MTAAAGELDAYRAQLRAWLEASLPLRDTRPELRSGREIPPEQLARDRARQQAVYEAGYLGITLPAEYGGRGLSKDHQRIWNEESARYAVPWPGGVASHVTLGVILPTIMAYGSERQKREWVPRMLSGEEIWAQLLSEPGAGSDLAGIQTRATRDGGEWVLDGAKIWSSGAMSADYGICLARTDWDVPKHRGLTWFKVPLHDERVTVRPVREINGSAEFCEEFLDGVIVADEMVIGEVNAGWPDRALPGPRPAAGGGAVVRKHAHTQRRLCARFAAPVIGAVTSQDITTWHIQQIVNAAPTAREGGRVRGMISALAGAGIACGYLANPRFKQVHWQAGDREHLTICAAEPPQSQQTA
jgi:hypothetical protein